MISFNSLSQLRNYVISNSKGGMMAVAEKVKSILKEYVENDVYNSYEPAKYKRTYELLDSISVKVLSIDSNGIKVEIYFDANKMSHTTLFGDENLGLKAGDNVYIPK